MLNPTPAPQARSQLLSLAEVRPLVERELLAERRRTQLQALYERLLAKYTVTIEMPKEEKKPAPATPGEGGAK